MALATRRRIVSGAVSAAACAAGAASLGAEIGEPPVWPGGARAAVSLTYDDGLASQLDNARPELDRFGLKGAFFLTQDNVIGRLADWQAVARAGHEIGNHTVNHPCQLEAVSAKSFDAREIEAMEGFLAASFPVGRVPIYAYTCGVLDLGRGGELREQIRYIKVLERHFRAARAVTGIPMDPGQVWMRRFALQASDATYEKDDPKLAIDYVRPALARGRWAILVFHDILSRRRNEGDTSIQAHRQILDWIASQPIWCAPMGVVLRHLGVIPEPAAAQAAR